MFRTLSITSGSTLLRRPSTLIYHTRSYGTKPSKNPLKQVQKTPKLFDAGIEDKSGRTPKPLRKYTPQKVLTGSNGDTGSTELAKDEEQGAADGRTSKAKKVKKTKSANIPASELAKGEDVTHGGTLNTNKIKKSKTFKNLEPELAKDGKQSAPGGGTLRTKNIKKPETVSRQEQLASEASDEDGLLQYLNHVYAGKTRKTQGGVTDFKRVNIVSKSLCDDTLERLKPSLEKHIGCDILDLNPGPGVWSSTLHNFLKPRTHILMEPDPGAFKPLLQPLLDAKGSTYKLVPKSGVIWKSLHETLSPELLPHQETLQPGNSLLEEQNNTLLLVANLGYNPKKAYRGFPSITSLVTYQLLSAARSHSLFHKYGLVRMLLWVDEDAKRTILPRSVLKRKKAAIEAEITCSDINEIISATDDTDTLRRDQRLELESSFVALEKMKEAGITTPAARRWPMEIEATKRISKNQDMKFELPRDFIKELNVLEGRFKAGEFTMFNDTPEGRLAEELTSQQMTPQNQLQKPPQKPPQTPEYNRMMGLRNKRKKLEQKGEVLTADAAAELHQLQEQFASGKLQRSVKTGDADIRNIRVANMKIKTHFTPEFARLHMLRTRKRRTDKHESHAEIFCEEYEAILSMRKKVKDLEGPAATRLQQEIDHRHSTLMEEVGVNKHQSHVQAIIYHMLDNRTAFYQDPPLLYWDRRRAEPLKANQDEFFPKTEMALLDFQPRSIWPSLRENFPVNYDVLEYILSTLFILPSQSVRQGITSLAPGALEWLLPECPSITDPKKGGNPYIDMMGVRCLTQEMVQEILEAWLKWPFRPSRFEVLSKMGSDVYDPDLLDLD